MTLPDERYRSLRWAEKFLHDLATDKKRYPRIPLAVRREAYSILRHYPSEWDLQRMAEQSPDIIAEKMEPLTRLVMQYEIDKKSPDNV
jgi:hypothetical protein